MKNKRILLAVITVMLAFSLCGCNENTVDNEVSETKNEITSAIEETQSESETTELQNNVASADETAAPNEISDEGLTPIYADSLNDGVYDVTVESSSSMFNIVSCQLTVENGKMNAVMTMGGKGYLYVFMGNGETAVNTDNSEYISFAENENGEHTFTVPVEALDKSLECTAFSKKKEQWYDRLILFRADSLPINAFKEDTFKTAESLNLEDGEYTADVELSGGSGRASVKSPADITIRNGNATAIIEWSSSNYDYMIVNDEKYLPINTDGNSAFEIPVTVFDRNFIVKADTTAMSTPHEIEYTLCFNSETITKK